MTPRRPSLLDSALWVTTCWLLVACQSPAPIEPDVICHPQDPACASLDYDQDGVPNGVDDFPLDPACSIENEESCGRCDRACEAGQRCQDSLCFTPPPEQCDGLDNDQDGTVDEALIAPRAERWRGVCSGLTQRCLGLEGWAEPEYLVVGHFEEEELSCDGLDNDCDGLSDEALLAPLSPEQRGRCEGLRLRCGGERGWLPPALEQVEGYEPLEQSCDGVDNDCDGVTDEQSGGERCLTDELGRCRVGATTCRGGLLSCESALSARAERCDGVDDDCDGLIDEALTPPLVEGALGVCQRDAQRCEGPMGWAPLPPEAISTYEELERSCDGLDNDCDGLTDEGLGGALCTRGSALGVCAQGVTRCEEGALVCAEERAPEAERCDGLDNDCDGAVDELTAELSPLYENQRGVCMGARLSCEGSQGWRPPSLNRLTHYEAPELSCDGLDNDCDGLSDEALGGEPCEGGGVGRCSSGERRCVAGVSACVTPSPQAEVCDGLDNDCDGAVDEELTPPDATPSAGVCGDRLQRCLGEAGWQNPPLDIPTYELQESRCDGLDNDCDGVIDEALIGPLASEQRGVCFGLTQRCIGAEGWAEPTLELTPDYELQESRCDGLDNDCDGLTDEAGAHELEGLACQTGALGSCGAGLWSCVDGEARCVALQLASPERCDGEDNDCDGASDEVGSGEGQLGGEPCAVGVGACVQQGRLECHWDPLNQLGSFTCVGSPAPPRDERCDGLDNDCDGLTDEQVASEGLPCAVGDGACVSQGVWRCTEEGLSCDATPAEPSAERCDELDNDCDGRVDEVFFQLGTPCVVGLGQCEIRSAWSCSSSGGVSCGDGPQAPSSERCDGLDNDCDGRSDEHIRPERCDGLDNDCDLVVDEGLGPELCDGEDNDCDGSIDESPCAPCGDDCPELSWSALPGGEFTMGGGSPEAEPARAVLLNPFQMSQEVTVSAYLDCIASGACSETLTGGDCNLGRPDRLDHPINCVTWAQAWDFAIWVGARLPSEAQWEYAARGAGRTEDTPWLNAEPVSCVRAQVASGGSFGCGVGASVPVCSDHLSLGQSPEGLCDLLGNVSEWVWDDYIEGYLDAPTDSAPRCDPVGCVPQGEKVTRGGGWRVDAGEVGARRREATLHGFRAADLGFRLVRSGP